MGVWSGNFDKQICSSLTPGDLLHLVQSSKIFALFLLAPASAAIWRVSRQQLDDGFPDCPDDLTEQKYACLAFGSACQVLLVSYSMRSGSDYFLTCRQLSNTEMRDVWKPCLERSMEIAKKMV